MVYLVYDKIKKKNIKYIISDSKPKTEANIEYIEIKSNISNKIEWIKI